MSPAFRDHERSLARLRASPRKRPPPPVRHRWHRHRYSASSAFPPRDVPVPRGAGHRPRMRAVARPPARRCGPQARCVTGSGRGSQLATVRSQSAQRLSVNGSFTWLNARRSENRPPIPSLFVSEMPRETAPDLTPEITGYYSFCDLHALLSIADKIGFVDFLTHSRYVCGMARRRLPSSRFTGSAVPAYFGAIKCIVVTTHRQVLISAVPAPLGPRTPASGVHVQLHVRPGCTGIGPYPEATQKLEVSARQQCCRAVSDKPSECRQGALSRFEMSRTSRAAEKGLCFAKSLVRGPWGAIR